MLSISLKYFIFLFLFVFFSCSNFFSVILVNCPKSKYKFHRFYSYGFLFTWSQIASILILTQLLLFFLFSNFLLFFLSGSKFIIKILAKFSFVLMKRGKTGEKLSRKSPLAKNSLNFIESIAHTHFITFLYTPAHTQSARCCTCHTTPHQIQKNWNFQSTSNSNKVLSSFTTNARVSTTKHHQQQILILWQYISFVAIGQQNSQMIKCIQVQKSLFITDQLR